MRDVLARRFARHAEELTTSPMYADLLRRCAADIANGGAVWTAMRGHTGPAGSMPTLRLLGAVHRLVLAGGAPDLAAYYPTAGGAYDGSVAWPRFVEAVTRVGEWLDAPVQTNEVARAGVLLGGFHTVSREFGRPLRLLEVGASAGLLLRFDAYRYVLPDGATWGPRRSPLTLDGFVTPVPLDPALRVEERRGCDRSPVDAASDEGRLLLESFVWADQPARLARLAAACAAAKRHPVALDRADAVEWVRARLAEPAGDAATVVYHSVVMGYLSRPARAAFADAVTSASVEPRAWLRFEPERKDFVLTLTTWPGGAERRLAVAHPHGYDVRWLTT